MNPWPITPLGTQDLDFAVVNYGFEGIAATALKDTPNLETAIDTDLTDFGVSISTQTPLLASLGDDLLDLPTVLTELDDGTVESNLADLGNAATAGDSLLNDFTSLFDTSGGGGSGGGGGGATGGIAITNATGSPLPCNASLDWPPQGELITPFTISTKFQNISGTDVQVNGMALLQPHKGVFSATTDAQSIVKAGATFTISITQNSAASNGDTVQVQVSFGQPAKTEVICWTVGQVTGGGGGGGRGGVGPTPILNPPENT
jgi:hypothetical protein